MLYFSSQLNTPKYKPAADRMFAALDLFNIENQQKQLFNMGERKKGIQKELGNDENYADVIAELKEKLAEIDNKLGVNKK